MQRGRKPDPQTELAELNQGLSSVEDPYNLAEFRDQSLEELVNAVRHELRYAVVALARAGRLFYAMKERVEHGDWLPLLQKHHIPRSYARDCMKMTEVIARYPKAIHLPPGRAIRQLLQSSMAKIDAVFSELPDAAIKQLTPWDLKTQLDKEKLKEKGNRYAPTGKEKHVDVSEPTELDKLYAKALSAVRMLEFARIAEDEHEKAEAYAQELSRCWDRAHYHLRDPKGQSVPPWELGAMDDISEEGLDIIKKGGRGHGEGRNLHA